MGCVGETGRSVVCSHIYYYCSACRLCVQGVALTVLLPFRRVTRTRSSMCLSSRTY